MVASVERVGVAVIGAGFSGLSVAHALRESGRSDFVVLERAPSVGGVWRDNTYPGVACDVPSHLYSLSFAPNPNWSHAFSSGHEIRNYLEHVAATKKLAPFIHLNEEMTSAEWDDTSGSWHIRTSRGSYAAKVLVACAGPLTEPVYPDIPGMEDFRGEVLHTSRWNADFDASGKRVVVVGTGASAVQVVPELGRVAKELTVLQRTPGWVVPRPNRDISAFERRVLGAFPVLGRVLRGRQYLVRDGLNYRMIRRNRFFRALFEKASRKMLGDQIKDPGLRRKLTPDYEIGCKRVLISSDFYPALAAPNAELVASGLSEMRRGSVVTADGTERGADAVVFATGFETTNPTIYRRIHGRGGVSLDGLWRGSPGLHRATSVAGFPNFFNICGPGTGSGHGSMIFKAESQTAYVMDALNTMRERGLETVEVRPEAQGNYMAWARGDLEETVWARGGCESWYLDSGDFPTLMWPRTMYGFRKMLRSFDAENYKLGYEHRNGNVRTTNGGDGL